MDEAWVEGSGVEGSYDNGLITGSCWDAATPGTYVAPGSLEAYDHQGTHVFYATSVPGLAADPQNASGRYVRAGPGAYQVWNYPFTPAASLADLAVLQNANTLAYFHDEAEATLYVSHATKGSGASGMQGVRWFSNVDLFASPSGRTIGDTFPSQTAGNPKQGWYAFDVTSIVTNWLSGGHANHGFKVTAARYKDAYFASADRMDNAATAVDERLWRPELVVDYISPPAPGTLIVVR